MQHEETSFAPKFTRNAALQQVTDGSVDRRRRGRGRNATFTGAGENGRPGVGDPSTVGRVKPHTWSWISDRFRLPHRRDQRSPSRRRMWISSVFGESDQLSPRSARDALLATRSPEKERADFPYKSWRKRMVDPTRSDGRGNEQSEQARSASSGVRSCNSGASRPWQAPAGDGPRRRRANPRHRTS